MYPELWKKSIFHMPYGVYCVLMLFATVCSGYYMYSYLADYDTNFIILALIITALLYVVCFVLVKTGKIDTKPIYDKKARIVAEIEEANKNV